MPQTAPRALVPRKALYEIRQALQDFRVVLINGPRQVGKTTILRQLQAEGGGTLLNLDDPQLEAAARDDPVGFPLGHEEPVMIDEIQRGGDTLVRAIKMSVDKDSRPGRFVLTGSTQFLTVPVLSESLAGRVAIIDLWPFSQSELCGSSGNFIDSIFDGPIPHPAEGPDDFRAEYFTKAAAGGFPEAVRIKGARGRSAWFDAYIQTVVGRDVADISHARYLQEMPHLLRLLAALTAQELNVAKLARGSQMSDETLRRYIPLLETVYLVHRVPAWSRNLTGRVKRHAKVYVSDSGLACHLLGVTSEALARPAGQASGAVMETFVVNEILKESTWSENLVDLRHFRDRNGREVDLILEARDGRIVGIEVKSSATVLTRDFRHLADLRDRLPEEFHRGIVLYAGTRTLSFGDRLMAMPISTIWKRSPLTT